MNKIGNNYMIQFNRDQIERGDPELLLGWKDRWPNFTPQELASRGDGGLIAHYKAIDALQNLRNIWRRPMVITSAYRDPKYNELVGGAKASLHLTGRAFDVSMPYSDAAVVSFIYHAVVAGFRGFGLYLDRPKPFVHIDIGVHRTWQSGQSRLDDTDDVTEMF